MAHVINKIKQHMSSKCVIIIGLKNLIIKRYFIFAELYANTL